MFIEFTSPETGCVSTATDPESLRFDFPEVCGNSSVDRTRAKKPPPTVYREQVGTAKHTYLVLFNKF